MEVMIMRRVFGSLVLASVMTMTGLVSSVAGQEATPGVGFDDLGLPVLDVTVSATGYEGIPESVEAGRYLVNVTAGEDIEFEGGVAFIQPSGIPAEEFLGMVFGPPSGAGEPEGSPVAEEGAPEEGGGEMALPPFIYDATFAGGAYAPAGETAQIVLDLTPGEWIAWADDPEGSQEPVVFEATGEMPADLVEPASGATITMGEYVIDVTEGALVGGSQIVKVENLGAQPHFVAATKLPDGTTNEQIEVVLNEEMTAAMTGTPPVYSDLNPETDFGDGFYTASQSNGTTIWIVLDIEPGTYGLLCFFPDMSDGMPHANHGMYNVVEVSE
jgi:hypothetical protein